MAPTANSQFTFNFGTIAQYTGLATKNANALYFITDTKQIYLGNDLYSGSVEFVNEFPATPSEGIIYSNPTTHETKVWNGTAWNVIVPAIETSIGDGTTGTNLANVAAIKDYVANQIGSAYTINKQATAETGFFATYQLFKGETAVGAKINIPKDFLIKSASMKVCETAGTPVTTPALAVGDPYLEFIVNTKDGSETDVPMYINVKGLVDIYTVDNTATVELAMDSANKITANVKISATANNIITANADGIFAEHYIASIEDTNSVDLDVTGKKLTAAVKRSADTGNILQEKADGLYVAPDYIQSIDDTTSVDLTVDANAKLTAEVKIATLAVAANQELKLDATNGGLYVDLHDKYYNKTEINAMLAWNAIA